MFALAATLVVGTAHAQTVFTWNPSGSGVPAGGSGSWNTTSLTWTPNNGTTYQAWPAPDSGGNGSGAAIFGGTAGTVTMSGSLAASALTFTSSGYVINGGGNTLTLRDPLGFAAIVRGTAAGNTFAINAPIAGNAGVTFAGPGTTTISGNHTFTGDLTVKDGATLKILSASSSLVATNTLYLGFNSGFGFGSGGTFILDNTGATGATSLTLSGGFGSGISVGGGDSIVQSNRVAAQTVTLDLSLYAFSRSTGATVNFIVNGGVNGTDNKIAFSSSSQSFGFQDQGTFFGGSNYAWIDSAGYVRAMNYGTDAGTSTTSGTTSVSSTSNLLATGSLTAQRTATFSTIKLSGTSGIAIATGNTVTVSGLLKTDGGSATISGGSGIKPTSGGELVIRTDQASDALTISSPILTNGTTNSLTKSGAGTLTLSGTNTYKGPTYINAGTLSVATIGNKGTNGPLGAGNATASSGGGNITIDGGSLQYTGATASSNRTISITTGGGGLEVTSSAATLTLNGTLTSNGSGVQNDALIKNGAGSLVLSGSTDNSGFSLQVNAGTVQLAKTSATFVHAVGSLFINNGATVLLAGTGGDQIYDGSSVTVNTGGTLNFSGKNEGFDGLAGGGSVTNTSTTANSTMTLGTNASIAPSTFSGIISDGTTKKLAIDKINSGTQVLSGANTYTGGTSVDGGTLQLGDGGTTGSIAGNVANNATLAFNRSDAFTFSGVVSGGGAVTQLGTGTLTLSATNSYSGGTNLARGTLAVATDANLGDASGTISFGGGALRATGSFTSARATTLTAGGGTFDVLSGATLTWNGAITGNAGNSLTKIGAGTLLLGGANTYSGTTFINAGTLKLGAASALSPNTTLNVAPGAFFDANGFQPTFGALSGTGQIDVGTTGLSVQPTGTDTFAGTLSGGGGLTMSGSGTLVLANTNSYSGTTMIGSGTVQLGTDGALPAGTPVQVASGATLDLNSHPATLSSLAGSGNITLGNATLTVAQTGNTTFSGTLAGSGGLTTSGTGTLILTGNNTYTGDTTITGGQLKLNGSATASDFMITGGKLSGNATVGSLTIGAGGTLSPGNSPGQTTVTGNATLAGGGAFVWQINSLTGTPGHDPGWSLLSVSGQLLSTATSGDPFTISLVSLTSSNSAGLLANFDATHNYSFNFVTAGSISGFDASAFTLNTNGFANSFTGAWSLAQSGSSLNLVYTGSAIPEPSTSAVITGALALGVATWRRRNAVRSSRSSIES